MSFFSGLGLFTRFLLTASVLLLSVVPAFPANAVEMQLEDFFRHAEFDNASLSPQGNYLAVSVPDGGQRNLAVLDISDPSRLDIKAALTMRGGESPVNIRWVNDERFIFSTQIQSGPMAQPQATGRIFAVDADGRNRRLLFGAEPGSFVFRQMDVISFLPDDPNHILIQHWAHDRTRPMAERLNIDRGRTSGVATSPLNRGALMADQNAQVRFAIGFDDDGKSFFSWRPTVQDEWRSFENNLGTNISPIVFDSSGDYIYVSSREAEHLGLYKLELATGNFERVFVNEHVEIDGSAYKFSADQTELLGVRFMDGTPEWHTIGDDAFEVQWLRQLEAMFEGSVVNISNWTEDGRRAMVVISSDISPPEFFLLDTETPELRFIAGAMPWVDPQQMQPMQPISFTAADGLTIHGYKTLPKGFQQGDHVPFVIWVHGGPHGVRDNWGFDPYTQMFAANGIGVLSVNFRGSGGYGIEFEQAGYLEWGGKMQQDITDATHWLLEQEVTTQDKLCIGGASYGGYSTLSGITQHPNLYACAFAFVGVYDLELMKTTGDVPQTEFGRRYLDRVLGTDSKVLNERSPTNYVERIRTPLFIAHGAEDIRAHVDHYHLLKSRLDDAGIDYEEMLVEGEGHGFYKLENNVALFSRVIDFMHRYTSLAD